MHKKPYAVLAVATFVTFAAPVEAQHADHAASHQTARSSMLPAEPGDAAFAAVSEIVALLMADPNTDWDRVDIIALRDHLVDMNRLMLDARVQSEPVENGLSMRIAIDGPGGSAARRMVPAHSPVLAAETGWSSDISFDNDGIVWTVIADEETDARRIAALGFFGLMAIGDHHRAHHLDLAKGEPMH